MAAPVEAIIVTGDPVPRSERDRALLGNPSLVTLKHDTEGDTMKVRIIRACGEWLEGEETAINADYARQLIGNGLAEEVKPKAGKPAPAGATAKP